MSIDWNFKPTGQGKINFKGVVPVDLFEDGVAWYQELFTTKAKNLMKLSKNQLEYATDGIGLLEYITQGVLQQNQLVAFVSEGLTKRGIPLLEIRVIKNKDGSVNLDVDCRFNFVR